MLMKETIGMYTEHRNIAVCIRDEFVQHVQQHCLRNKYSNTLKKTIQITLRNRLSFSGWTFISSSSKSHCYRARKFSNFTTKFNADRIPEKSFQEPPLLPPPAPPGFVHPVGVCKIRKTDLPPSPAAHQVQFQKPHPFEFAPPPPGGWFLKWKFWIWKPPPPGGVLNYKRYFHRPRRVYENRGRSSSEKFTMDTLYLNTCSK